MHTLTFVFVHIYWHKRRKIHFYPCTFLSLSDRLFRNIYETPFRGRLRPASAVENLEKRSCCSGTIWKNDTRGAQRATAALFFRPKNHSSLEILPPARFETIFFFSPPPPPRTLRSHATNHLLRHGRRKRRKVREERATSARARSKRVYSRRTAQVLKIFYA